MRQSGGADLAEIELGQARITGIFDQDRLVTAASIEAAPHFEYRLAVIGTIAAVHAAVPPPDRIARHDRDPLSLSLAPMMWSAKQH